MAARRSTSASAGIEGSNLYKAFGGREGCRRLSTAFYARVSRDPLLRPLFPGTTFTCAIEAFAAFLAQFLGGPEDMQRRWWLSLRESHLRFRIGQREREAWMGIMGSALGDLDRGAPARRELLGVFERSSAHIVNHGETPAISEGRTEAFGDGTGKELARCWDAQARTGQGRSPQYAMATRSTPSHWRKIQP